MQSTAVQRHEWRKKETTFFLLVCVLNLLVIFYVFVMPLRLYTFPPPSHKQAELFLVLGLWLAVLFFSVWLSATRFVTFASNLVPRDPNVESDSSNPVEALIVQMKRYCPRPSLGFLLAFFMAPLLSLLACYVMINPTVLLFMGWKTETAGPLLLLCMFAILISGLCVTYVFLRRHFVLKIKITSALLNSHSLNDEGWEIRLASLPSGVLFSTVWSVVYLFCLAQVLWLRVLVGPSFSTFVGGALLPLSLFVAVLVWVLMFLQIWLTLRLNSNLVPLGRHHERKSVSYGV